MNIKFNETVGEYEKDNAYEVEDTKAEKFVAAGLAEKVVSETDTLLAEAGEQIEKKINDAVGKIASQLNSVEVKTPAVPKKDDRSFAEFVQAVGKSISKDSRIRESAVNLLANKYAQKTTLTQGTNATAGYLVPEEWVNELLFAPGYDGAMFPSRVRTIPMATDKLYLPVIDQTVAPSSGSSAFYGGVVVDFVSEGSAPESSTNPAFKQLAISASKLLAYTQVTSELVDNSPISVEQILKDTFRGAITAKLDYEIFNGTTLTAIIDNAANVDVERNTASDVKLQDFANMWCRMLPASRANAVWFVNPLVLAKLPLLGNSNHLVWLPNGVNGAPQLTILGSPVVACESLPAVGSTGDVLYVDPRYYVLGINKNIAIEASEHYAFTSDMTTYRCTMRCGGKPQLTAPIKLQNGTDTVSPYVQLESSVAS